MVDWCLAHPQVVGLFHYHTASTCIGDSAWKDKLLTGKLQYDVKDAIRDSYTSGLKFRSVFGISKDGRPIYTPLYNNAKEVKDCEVDICNGLTVNGHYAYTTTLFRPYVMGCYGPNKVVEGLHH